jgi:tetrapyrrole methylase family protein/MazG family protein
MWAAKLQSKAATVGFDWSDYRGPLAKTYEELEELQLAIGQGDLGQIEKEAGDLLFSVVNLARLLKIDPEIVLLAAGKKFIKRFSYVERKALENNHNLASCTLDQMNIWWEEAKTIEI